MAYRNNPGNSDQWQPQGRDPRWQPQQWPPERHDPGDRWQQQPPARPRQAPPPRRPAPRRSLMPLAMAGCIVIALAAVGVAAWAVATRTPAAATAGTGASAPTGSAAQPETAAAVRQDATQFYALYSGGQWAAAWQYLTPAAQAKAPVATWTAVHDGCPSASAGLARTIKGVTVAGTAAVVTETIAGTLGSLGTVADAWDYSAGRWGIQPPASSLAVYSHGSVAADIAAAKAAGDCK